jgi:hypothetical protein
MAQLLSKWCWNFSVRDKKVLKIYIFRVEYGMRGAERRDSNGSRLSRTRAQIVTSRYTSKWTTIWPLQQRERERESIHPYVGITLQCAVPHNTSNLRKDVSVTGMQLKIYYILHKRIPRINIRLYFFLVIKNFRDILYIKDNDHSCCYYLSLWSTLCSKYLTVNQRTVWNSRLVINHVLSSVYSL